ncbi:MAG: Xaa-Pro dipeptidase [Actinobacteria bacterium HGW-Actinobacteria-10]|nr:MAG: Xaa-Pro dipeptidase [Actinobacteria bacterium HGW-Actinobacteria-10]
MNAQARVDALQRRLDTENIPAIMISDVSNVRYLTGFENVFDDHANVALAVTPTLTIIYTDSRYAEAIEAAAAGTTWTLVVPRETLYIDLCEDLEREGIEYLAIESSVPYGRFKFICERFGGNVQAVDQWVEKLRQVKEAEEIDRIARAAALTDRAFDYLVRTLEPGMTELQIALAAEVFMRENGSEGVAFPIIAAGGPNSSRPHAQCTDRPISEGDFLTIDMGARVQGYCSDMTRTVVVGKASERQIDVYEAVRQANEAATLQVRGGLPGSQIDAVARELLVSKGYGEYFGHGLGHGVGLDVHELPRVGPSARDSVLAGSIITIEPGIYIPEFGGVRIEDLLVVEEGGYRVLSTSPRTLIEI